MTFKNHGPGGCCCGVCDPIKIPDRYPAKFINPNCKNPWHYGIFGDNYITFNGSTNRGRAFDEYEYWFHESETRPEANYPEGSSWNVESYPAGLSVSGPSAKWVRGSDPGAVNAIGPFDDRVGPNLQLGERPGYGPLDIQYGFGGTTHGMEVEFFVAGDTFDFTLVVGTNNFNLSIVDGVMAFHIKGTPGQVSVMPVSWVHSTNNNSTTPWAKGYGHNYALARDYVTKNYTPSGNGTVKFTLSTEYGIERKNGASVYEGFETQYYANGTYIAGRESIMCLAAEGTDLIRCSAPSGYGEFGFAKTPVGNYRSAREQSGGNLVDEGIRFYPADIYLSPSNGPLNIGNITITPRQPPESGIILNNVPCFPSGNGNSSNTYDLDAGCVAERYRDGIPFAMQDGDSYADPIIPKSIDISGCNLVPDGSYITTPLLNPFDSNKPFRQGKDVMGFDIQGLTYTNYAFTQATKNYTVEGSSFSSSKMYSYMLRGFMVLEFYIRTVRSPFIIGEPTSQLSNIVIWRPVFDPSEHDASSRQLEMNESNCTWNVVNTTTNDTTWGNDYLDGIIDNLLDPEWHVRWNYQ